MILSCPDVHLICINDFSLLTVCLNANLISERASTYVCIASCNLSALLCLLCAKYTKLTYLRKTADRA